MTTPQETARFSAAVLSPKSTRCVDPMTPPPPRGPSVPSPPRPDPALVEAWRRYQDGDQHRQTPRGDRRPRSTLPSRVADTGRRDHRDPRRHQVLRVARPRPNPPRGRRAAVRSADPPPTGPSRFPVDMARLTPGRSQAGLAPSSPPGSGRRYMQGFGGANRRRAAATYRGRVGARARATRTP